MLLPLTPARALPVEDVALGPLRADVRDYGYPGIRLYPAPVRKHGPLTEAEVAAGVHELVEIRPRGLVSRVWPFFLDVSAANLRTTVVSPRFTAPAMIYEMHVQWSVASLLGSALSLLWSEDDQGGVTDGAETLVPSGASVLEQISARRTTALPTSSIPGFFMMLNDLAAGRTTARLHYLIDAATPFHLKLSLSSPTGGGQDSSRGYVTVLQAQSFAELRRLL